MLSHAGKLALIVVAALCLAPAVYAQSAEPITAYDDRLEPDTWNSLLIGPSWPELGCVAEITPTSLYVGGASIEKYVMQPEFDGSEWNDALRVMLSPGSAPLDVNVRAYGLVDMPVIRDFDTQLQTGVWHGFWLGRAYLEKAYVAEITPDSIPAGCSSLEWIAIQQEFDGYNWNDVLRLMTPAGCAPLNVNIRVYEIVDMPIVQDLQTQLQPGVWHQFQLGPSSLNRAYVTDITPTADPIGCNYAGQSFVQPEFDGVQWNDVLRVMLPTPCAPQDANIQVYALPGAAAELDLLVGDVESLENEGILNSGQGNALTTKLDAALKKLDDGNSNAAANQLGAFVNQVNSLVAEGTLTAEEGQALIDCANATLAEIEG